MIVPKKSPPLWIGVAISFYAFITIGIAEAGLGVLLPSILQEYNLTSATITLLFVSQISGYILAALTSSIVNSRLGLGRMLFFAASMLTIALSIYALSPTWWLMVAAGNLFGLGVGLIDAGINTAIAQDDHSTNLIGLLHGFYGIGALSGAAIATTLLAIGMNWRQVYGVLAAIVSLLMMSVLAAIIYRYPSMTQSKAAFHTPAWQHLGRSLQTPLVWFTGLLLLIYVGLEASISNWAYIVQVSDRQIPALVAGYSLSAYWVGLTVGRFILGYFLRSLGAVKTISMSLVLLMIGLLAWWQLPEQWISLPMIGFALAPIFPATIWLIPKQLPASLVPAAVSFATSAASVGAAMIPSGVGWIASWSGLGIIPVLMLPLAIAMIVLHWANSYHQNLLET
ncbi:MFS transporter [Pseudanabaena sp. ABRG5-3]|uniref:MFS transporter n=1 Tax=Pseudanabaena sp. ABRG5-3 TaxID=685565 RepID=UPI000DC71EC9|nr:MFS transporter [Pseudanabaena sp. ABRG5-3]BBC27120.1 major facilitator superfamily MFS_1 [Pseudanabaena sp. ABRG5-3]